MASSSASIPQTAEESSAKYLELQQRLGGILGPEQHQFMLDYGAKMMKVGELLPEHQMYPNEHAVAARVSCCRGTLSTLFERQRVCGSPPPKPRRAAREQV